MLKYYAFFWVSVFLEINLQGDLKNPTTLVCVILWIYFFYEVCLVACSFFLSLQLRVSLCDAIALRMYEQKIKN